ncbi:WcaF family extracellular polysaccharide biosynthesis acetyltransferase [Salinibacter ruber]|uniref:WcaF family extracellular polysaccharide biosynthesis acetyltransferase n=1 Tax=Salinibacter ruber TaxID=146919 RepID=UPI002168A81D|nr:WcaF family extracellular polysaccharide biosynthesis acetyltransferase [Salinibacter ruber]MCS3824335.1 putative colanic acid biosynthesis acetyltransferase WcaF [Salinibacter ruber]
MSEQDLNIAENRSAQKYEWGEIVRRVLWGVGAVLFRWTPRLLYGVRNALLRLFGAEIGKNVRIHPSATIYFPWNVSIGDWSSVGEDAMIYNLGPIAIGEKVTVSQRAHLCAGTHDATDPAMPLQKPPISVGDQAWICADAFVGPGVTVEEGAVVGARAVAVSDVEPWTVVAGNPASHVRNRTLQSG